MKSIQAIIVVGIVLLSACGHVATAQYHTTGAQCLAEDKSCDLNSDCCSKWCVNGVCEQRQP